MIIEKMVEIKYDENGDRYEDVHISSEKYMTTICGIYQLKHYPDFGKTHWSMISYDNKDDYIKLLNKSASLDDYLMCEECHLELYKTFGKEWLKNNLFGRLKFRKVEKLFIKAISQL